jgi:hypothetical protein
VTRVWGLAIEPGGMELENEYVACRCPDCAETAQRHNFESCADGSINQHWTIFCSHCGHSSGDD